jgi:hypothetical protein
MRASFLLTTLMLALGFGIVSAVTGSGLVTGALLIGLLAVTWGMWRAVERVTGKDLWHFRAPYPYRWMRRDAVDGAAANLPRGRDATRQDLDPDLDSAATLLPVP